MIIILYKKSKKYKINWLFLDLNPGVIGINFFNWIIKLDHATILYQ